MPPATVLMRRCRTRPRIAGWRAPVRPVDPLSDPYRRALRCLVKRSLKQYDGPCGQVAVLERHPDGFPALFPELVLEKTAPTSVEVAAGVAFKGLEGQTLTQLSFDVKTGDDCGGGAPRFNLTTDAGTGFAVTTARSRTLGMAGRASRSAAT
jgi:hypothetical protein